MQILNIFKFNPNFHKNLIHLMIAFLKNFVVTVPILPCFFITSYDKTF